MSSRLYKTKFLSAFLSVQVLLSVLLVMPGCAKRIDTTSGYIKESVGVITASTNLYKDPDKTSEILTKLNNGDLIRVIKKNNDSWVFVECFLLSYPRLKGYIGSSDYSLDTENNTPNQGIIHDKYTYYEPNLKTRMPEKRTLLLSIQKRENGFAYCEIPGGEDNVWVLEKEIECAFPQDEK